MIITEQLSSSGFSNDKFTRALRYDISELLSSEPDSGRSAELIWNKGQVGILQEALINRIRSISSFNRFTWAQFSDIFANQPACLKFMKDPLDMIAMYEIPGIDIADHLNLIYGISNSNIVRSGWGNIPALVDFGQAPELKWVEAVGLPSAPQIHLASLRTVLGFTAEFPQAVKNGVVIAGYAIESGENKDLHSLKTQYKRGPWFLQWRSGRIWLESGLPDSTSDVIALQVVPHQRLQL